jgi:hypothetical protein
MIVVVDYVKFLIIVIYSLNHSINIDSSVNMFKDLHQFFFTD